MNILIILGAVIFIVFSVWYAKKNGATSAYNVPPQNVKTKIDSPIDFGYKIVWIAVKTSNKAKLGEIIGLKNPTPANWESGIKNAFTRHTYITPQIGQWTLAVGMGLPSGDSLESIEKVEKLLNKLSASFGEAQFFGSHRVVGFHCWMKSVDGKMERVYSYIGESGENIMVKGQPTFAEEGVNLFNSLSEDALDENYGERNDIVYPDEEMVLEIAKKWSVNPANLSANKEVLQELGIVG